MLSFVFFSFLFSFLFFFSLPFQFPSITSFSFEFVKEKEKEKEKGKEKEKEKEKVKEKEKEKEKARGGSTAALPETKGFYPLPCSPFPSTVPVVFIYYFFLGILYSDSNVLSQFKLMHISQQEPLSDILRIITEGGDPSSYFRVFFFFFSNFPYLLTYQNK